MDYLNNITTLKKYASIDLFREAAHSENTRAAYKKSWKCFSSWCDQHGLIPKKAKSRDIVNFLVSMANEGSKGSRKPLALNTLRLYRSGLNYYWRKLGLQSPTSNRMVDEVMQGLARIIGSTPRRVKAIRKHQLIAMLNSCSQRLHGTRDAAVLSLGFSAALRRSEICNLRLEDLERKDSKGIMLHIRRSKTDQQGTGQRIAVMQGKEIKAIDHLDRWLSAANISKGFVFQTLLRGGIASGRSLDPGDVARIVKRRAKKIGLDPREYSGHSLRAGFVTCAAAAHARIDKIMEVTRHKSPGTLMKYIRDEESFVDHAGAAFL